MHIFIYTFIYIYTYIYNYNVNVCVYLCIHTSHSDSRLLTLVLKLSSPYDFCFSRLFIPCMDYKRVELLQTCAQHFPFFMQAQSSYQTKVFPETGRFEKAPTSPPLAQWRQ